MPEQQVQPDHTLQPKRPNVEPYYNYRTLKKGHIRLLGIEPLPATAKGYSPADVEKDLHVTVKEYSLQACPPYIALSYTWGAPTVIADPTTSMFTTVPRCYPIYCDGRVLRGTRNLRDALRRLRQGDQVRKSSTYKQSELEQDALGDTGLYWIDAICVG